MTTELKTTKEENEMLRNRLQQIEEAREKERLAGQEKQPRKATTITPRTTRERATRK